MGDTLLDATEWRRDDGAICGAIGTSPLQGFAMALTLEKFNHKRLRRKPMEERGRLSSASSSLVVSTLDFRVGGAGFEPRGGTSLLRNSGMFFVLMSTREQ